jgi:predicted CoA-binding protein
VNSQPEDDLIREVLTTVRTIAVVGASENPARDSNDVMRFLMDRGYEVFPVNPASRAKEIHGRKVYASLKEVPEAIDMVDVFRRSEVAGEVCDEAVRAGAKVVWMQLGVINESGKQRAEAAGLKVIMDRCPKIETRRLAVPPRKADA